MTTVDQPTVSGPRTREQDEAALVDHVIGGDRCRSREHPLVVRDPSSGRPVTRAPLGGLAEVSEAVSAARAAAPSWSSTTAAERGAALARAAAEVEASTSDLARWTTAEMGRPLAEAEAGVAAGVDTLRQYAVLAPLHRGRALNGAAGAMDAMVHRPRGVVGVITPWNDPVAIMCGLIGAAVVTGNTVVLKPSERVPGTGAALAAAFTACLPPGVVNAVLGNGEAGAALAGHDQVDMVAHVGSTAAGRAISAAVAARGAHVILENGGKDALVVDAGVDPAWAAGQVAIGAFANTGQICTSVERVYVHASVCDEFTAHLVEAARRHVVGPGWDPDTTVGPLVDRCLRSAVHRQVTDAVARGATLLTGGRVPDGPGAYYPPTVLTGVADDAELMRTETFGPVAPVRAVASFDEGVELAARSPYGLAATVLTPRIDAALDVASRLPVGTVKVNEVFGGAPGGAAHPRRASGHGFGYGPELLDEMTVTQVVHIAAPPAT